MIRWLTLVVTALALAGCAPRAAVAPKLQLLDLALSDDCPEEPEIPAAADATGLGESKTAALLAWYRAKYPWCRSTKHDFVAIIQKRDGALGGAR